MTFISTTDRSPAGVPGPLGPLRMTPGRWLALAVAVPVALALIGWTGFNLISTLARGSYPFSYTVPVTNGQVAMNVTVGAITLHGGPDGGPARLTGTVQYGLVRPGISEFTTSAGTNLGVNCAGISTINCDVNATLDVPAKTGVTLWSNGADVTASGFSSGMTLQAAGGGDLNGNGLSGNLQLITEGGNVGANGMASQQVAVQSGGGNVTLAFAQVPRSLQITAEGGNVTVILPPGNTKYAVSTPDTSGGNVSYPSSLVNSNSLHTITIDSGGGDVTIGQG